jgi:acetyl-CoA acyltransferase 2
MLGESKVVLAGGAENMSQCPLSAYGQHSRFGVKLGGGLNLVDTLWAALTDNHTKMPMGVTAENLAKQFSMTREELDEFAAHSQAAWAAAHEAGKFAAEIAPIQIKGRKGMESFEVDEHPRPGTTAESLSKLSPVFDKAGLVTAGSSSGINDGAAMMVVASEEAVKAHGFTPLARVVSWGISGVDPNVMGYGPIPAIRQALERAGKTINDMDLVEVNEAFAPVAMAAERELGIDRSKLNACGGAIAMGHPLGASGARITTHLAHQLAADDKKKFAVGSACIGGGQGIAVVLERA